MLTQESLFPSEKENTVSGIRTSFVDFEIYHDESKRDGYWHGMLLVPCEQKEAFFCKLQEERNKIGYDNQFSFKEISSKGDKFRLAKAWLSLAVGFLRSDVNHEPYPVDSWSKDLKAPCPYILPYTLMGAKFILFRVNDNHENMTYFEDKVCNIETTARMGLKGGLHFLGSNDHPIHINRIHFDGHEHYLRDLDCNRIVDRLKIGLREYCSFSPNYGLLDTRSSKLHNFDHQEFIDCEFLLLTDLLIGSFRQALTHGGNKHTKKLTESAEQILTRHLEGAGRMLNSRWSNSFWLSQCRLENNAWIFEPLQLTRADKNSAIERLFQE